MMPDEREGAKQPGRFDPRKAAMLDDPERFGYLPPAELFALLDAPPGAVVLDFGAGTGTYALLWAQARPDLTVVAWDEQPRMLALLEKKLSAQPAPNVRPCLAEERNLAAWQSRAARILALNVLHELGDAALGQLRLLLAPGGQVAFVDWDAEVERPVGPPREHVLAAAEARDRVQRLGFRVLRQQRFRYQYALVCAAAQ